METDLSRLAIKYDVGTGRPFMRIEGKIKCRSELAMINLDILSRLAYWGCNNTRGWIGDGGPARGRDGVLM